MTACFSLWAEACGSGRRKGSQSELDDCLHGGVGRSGPGTRSSSRETRLPLQETAGESCQLRRRHRNGPSLAALTPRVSSSNAPFSPAGRWGVRKTMKKKSKREPILAPVNNKQLLFLPLLSLRHVKPSKGDEESLLLPPPLRCFLGTRR